MLYQINLIVLSCIGLDTLQRIHHKAAVSAFLPPVPWKSWRTWAASGAEKGPAFTASREKMLNQCFYSCSHHISTELCSLLFHDCFSPSGDFWHQNLCQRYCQFTENQTKPSSQDSFCKNVIKCEKRYKILNDTEKASWALLIVDVSHCQNRRE